MKSESEVQQHIQMQAVSDGCILMRNNSGALKDAQGRVVRFGLGNVSGAQNAHTKSSDLIGITSRVVTQDMVGSRVAIFTAVEVKTPDWKFSFTDRELAQERFIEWVKSLGGFAGFANSVEAFRKIVGK